MFSSGGHIEKRRENADRRRQNVYDTKQRELKNDHNIAAIGAERSDKKNYQNYSHCQDDFLIAC